MFIQTEATPNPATLKFLPGRDVMGAGTADFPTSASAAKSPLATRLFEVEGVVGVFFGADFVTVTKTETVEWHHLKPAVLGAIMEHFTTDDPVMAEGAATGAADESFDEADADIVAQIRDLIENRVRPAVAQDGGDIVFRGYDQGIVLLEMQGSCSGCPSSLATLKMGIENMLRHYIPEILEVRPV